MIAPTSLGALSTTHELLTQLAEDLPARDLNRRWHADLPSMGWLLGRSIYLELYWLRERLQGDDDLSKRVRHIFASPLPPTAGQDAALPPKEHLLNWALEIQDQHLTLLANPGMLPDHPWLENGWLVDYLLQVHGLIYEKMLSVRHARAVRRNDGYQVHDPLQARLPVPDTTEISQGHYRIGAREGVVFDNEQPLQMVEMRNFRICKQPVDNAAWLAFMEDYGYRNDEFWDEAGRKWRDANQARHPWHWRQDDNRNWYAIGINGPLPLVAEMPVSGISWHEAQAFAYWASARTEGFRGAILPHEYHWEAAARIGGLQGAGQVWEWCSNSLHPYRDYEAPVDPEMRTREFDGQHMALRGGCIHTQPSLRRISLRSSGLPQAGYQFSGLRLILPPALEEEALYIEQWQKFLDKT
ncbi:formylglycine-generating enzyme family protein [Thiolapillus sp.]